MTIEVGERAFEVDATPVSWYRSRGGRRLPAGRGGPGALTISGLDASTTYDISLSGEGWPRRAVNRARTLGAPPGRLLARFATISDCHLGERRFGPLGLFHDPVPRPPGLEPYPLRCAKAAIDECQAWGAELLVAKGDLTQNGKSAEVAAALDVLRHSRLPVAVALGNHDVRGPVDASKLLSAGGFPTSDAASYQDLPGVRVVLGHSPIPDRHSGRLPRKHVDEVVALASARDVPAVIALHHPLRRHPVETHYPPSVTWRDSRRLASALSDVNPFTLVISGHTHRNRLYTVAGVPVAEVGSTKDYPGQWAGYSVYEGGIRQVVRRTVRPDVIMWNEMTSRALGGIWGRWSPGSLGDRCWTLHWERSGQDSRRRIERAAAPT